MKKIIITCCCVLWATLQIHAQGIIIPDGITYNPNVWAGYPGVDIIYSLDYGYSTPVWFEPKWQYPPGFPIVNDTFILGMPLWPGVRIFSLHDYDMFTLQEIQSGYYNAQELTATTITPTITYNENVPFYLGFYIDGSPFGTIDYENIVWGWGQFVNKGGTLNMLASELYTIPEPSTSALLLFGLGGFLGWRKRLKKA